MQKGKIIKEESKIKNFQKGNVNGKWNVRWGKMGGGI
jgi:hypothetical protein